MFGHRWLRDADYDRLLMTLDVRRLEVSAAQDEIRALLERLIEAEAGKRSAQTMRDGLITRVNQLEEESAMLRHKLTGLPQIAPKIERGHPISASSIGAGVDLFEDVGDEKARELHDSGLLHEVGDDLERLPSAASLTEHLT